MARRDLLRLRNEDSSLRAVYNIAKGRLEAQAAKLEELQAALDAAHAAPDPRRRSLLAGAAAAAPGSSGGDDAGGGWLEDRGRSEERA